MKFPAAMFALALVVTCLSAIAADRPQGYVGIEQRLTPAQLREVGLTAGQIELLDRYLSESRVAPAPAPAMAPTANAGAAAPSPDRHLIGLDQAPIHSRLEGSVAGWEPGTVFTLENGQQWQVLKGRMKLRRPVEAPEIVVVPGIAGRWFLQVDPDLPKARVFRID